MLVTRPNETAASSIASVAICIGTYNQAQYLGACVESALSQDYPIQEIWISDDASTDGTAELMESMCKVHPTLHYYKHGINRGIAENLSWVLSQPSTEFIVRIDSDDLLDRAFVKTLIELMRKYPQAGYAHGDVYEIDSSGARKKTRRLHRNAVYECGEESLKRGAKGYRVAANCILFRAAALSSADYYRPNLEWKSAEDWDLSLRLAILGWGNVYAAAPLASYRVWDDDSLTRFRRIVPEIEAVTRVYRNTLGPAYLLRGWSTTILRRNMRKRAIGFAVELDSPLFSQSERAIYKACLRELGDSLCLSIAIRIAESGLNPLVRSINKSKLALRTFVKQCIRAAIPIQGARQ